MPSISEIPDASTLQAQLAQLQQAITALGVDGTTITNMVILPAQNPNTPTTYVASIGLTLNPPIQDPATISQLQTELESQAATVTQQLVSMGYTDDSGAVVLQGPAAVTLSMNPSAQVPPPQIPGFTTRMEPPHPQPQLVPQHPTQRGSTQPGETAEP